MTGPPDGAAPHVVVADVEVPDLDAAARHHLTRVRRARSGEPLTVTDGMGRWRWCRFDGTTVEADGPVECVDRPEPRLTVAFALTKSDKPDLVVQKLTELGVDRIVPFRAERSVVRWDDAKAAAAVERLRAVAVSALEQSKGVWAPEVTSVTDVTGLVALGARRCDRDGDVPLLTRPVLAVGPEGGWSAGEREALPESICLGPSVLRAETAALTAGGLLCALRAGIVGPVG